MGTRKTVFASRTEREHYLKLARNWAEGYNLYHNLPFLNVFTPNSLVDLGAFPPEPFELDARDFARLKKTSIDYVLCDTDDAPLVAIDFDGLNEGFNVGSTYHPHYPPAGPWREEITNLKLRVAHGSFFPYFVVGSEQFADLSPDVRLCAVDGIIGAVLANRQAHLRLARDVTASDLGLTPEELEALRPDEQQELLQDWVIGVEVEADMAHNPVTRRYYDLYRELGFSPYSVDYLTYPELPPAASPVERAQLDRHTVLQGCRYTLSDPAFGDIEAVLMLPAFRTPYSPGLDLCEELAGIIALTRLKRLRAGKLPDSQIRDI